MSLSSKFGWLSGRIDNKKSIEQSQQETKINKEIQLLDGKTKIQMGKMVMISKN